MSFNIPKQIIQSITVIIAAVVLLFSINSGMGSGKSQAQGLLVSNNAVQIANGLKYFYNDQDRYPSAAEFQTNQSLMLVYFNKFPAQEFVSGSCAESFVYQRPTTQTFKLNFCLPSPAGDFSAGWNQFNQNSKF